MPRLWILAPAFALLACSAQAGGGGADRERTLADELGGRSAGSPVGCVNLREMQSSRIVPGGEAILFRGPGGVLYLNRPETGCEAPGGVTIRTRSPTGRLCRGEAVALVHPEGNSAGTCILGDFTPYRRTR